MFYFTIKKFNTVLIFLLTIIIYSNSYGQNSSENPPNIILILADDLGYGDVSAYGGEVETPNIDRLAKEGLKFTDFHTNGASCSPTRAALITGRYQQRVGIEGALGEDALGLGNPDAKGEVTMAEYFKRAGYKTGKIGKWHLGYNLEQSPIHFGFDEFIGMLHGATDYHSHVNTFGRFDWWHNENLVREKGYVTHLITDHSNNFIKKWQEDPFFLFVSHLAIHFPWQTADDDPHREEGKQYRDVSGPLNRLGQHPPQKTGEVVREMIVELDKSVGEIIDKVYELNLENKTIILFLSDNGGITEYDGGYTEISSNYPLRGAKHSLYEGGHRVPAIAWWPGKIEAGASTDETVLTMDLLPTFLELTNINLPDSKGPIQQVEQEMREKNITEDRINVLGKKYFINDVRKKHPEIKQIIFSEKTAEVCKATIGDTAYLHNEQFVVKMTNKNSNFAWHQDSGYSVYQGGAEEHKPYLTCWVALDDMSEENGTISVLPFSRSPSRDLIEHKWDPKANAMIGYNGPDTGDFVKVKAGSLVAFSSFLLHKSGANVTDRPRRSYFMAFTPELFTYVDDLEKVYSSGEPLIREGELTH